MLNVTGEDVKFTTSGCVKYENLGKFLISRFRQLRKKREQEENLKFFCTAIVLFVVMKNYHRVFLNY